jgi:hypothetical protein
MQSPLSPHVRPINFAGIELLLDLLHCVRRVYSDVDMEGLVILLCVSDATMRPFMLDASTPLEILLASKPPEEVRGSISRRLIADKTGLPRETVRRKILELGESGHVTVDGGDRVRIAQRLYEPRALAAVEEAHSAVLRYLDRLKQFGVDPWSIHPQPGAPLSSAPDRHRRCATCGQEFDTEDADAVFYHGPEPHIVKA